MGKHLKIIIDGAKFRQNRFTCRVKPVWYTNWELQVAAIWGCPICKRNRKIW